jgi:hypothetical protein
MGLHDISKISRLESTTALFGIIQSGDIQNPAIHDAAHDDYPGLSGLPEEIMGLFNAMGHSSEFTRGAGIGALLVVRTLIQFTEAEKIETDLPGSTQ